MRLAWLGPAPNEGGGVPFVALQLLTGLADRGVHIDLFAYAARADLPRSLIRPTVRLFTRPPRWGRNSGPLTNDLTFFVGGMTDRSLAQARLTIDLLREHRRSPYDLVYQFSQLELHLLRPMRVRLPPIVTHPETYAAAELRWLLAERDLPLSGSESPRWKLAVALMRYRAHSQRRDVQLTDHLIVPAERFAELVQDDYGVPRDRMTIIRNPIDVTRFSPPPRRRSPEGRPLTAVFVSRISVRKGVEMVVALSHRLRDLAGHLEIVLVGGHTLWSDYRAMLTDLEPSVAQYVGQLDGPGVRDLLRQADFTVQPSRFEPFGLVVGEALATGLPVVVSDQVGAAEGIGADACRSFPDGDMDAFEAQVRRLVDDLRAGQGDHLAVAAREEAVRSFSRDVVAARLEAKLEEIVTEAR